jgi:exoribonuclease R
MISDYQVGRLILSSRNTYKTVNKSAKQCNILSEKMDNILINTSKEFNVRDNYVLIDTTKKQIIDNYGLIGVQSDDLNIYHYLYTYFWNSNTKLHKYFKDFNFEYDIVNKREIYSNEVITIDPFGSVDLDDGFSLSFNENIINLDIHIADPMSFFDFDKLSTWNIINELSKRVSTCYIPLNEKIKHLLPEINIGDKTILEQSTLIGKNKRAISFCFIINSETENIDFTIKKTILENINNTTYEKYDKYINKDNHYKNKLVKLCNFMIKKMNCNIEFNEIDISHKLIEVFMIWTNYYSGNYLYEKKNIMFVRTQDKFIDSKIIIPEYAKTFLNVGAKYEFIESKRNSEFIHYSLGIKNYCHVTSPMRRFIDMINHLLLHDINDKSHIYNNLVKLINSEEINSRLKTYKKLSNGYDLLTHLNITNKFKGCVFDKFDNNKVLLVLYDEKNNFKKIIKTILPIDYDTIKKYDEINIELFYDPYKFKTKSLPFSIKIIN